MVCLSQDQFFIRHKLSTLEAFLMVIYNLSHNESVDQGWALLGMALNIGIALRCNVDSQDLNPIEDERRRRCWAGLLSLHIYQRILFRDGTPSIYAHWCLMQTYAIIFTFFFIDLFTILNHRTLHSVLEKDVYPLGVPWLFSTGISCGYLMGSQA